MMDKLTTNNPTTPQIEKTKKGKGDENNLKLNEMLKLWNRDDTQKSMY